MPVTKEPSFVRIYEEAAEGNGDSQQFASLVDSLRRPQARLQPAVCRSPTPSPLAEPGIMLTIEDADPRLDDVVERVRANGEPVIGYCEQSLPERTA